MEARFDPLRLPTVLHDLPQNYFQRIYLFEGEGSSTTKYHVAKFENFVDLPPQIFSKSKVEQLSFLGRIFMSRRNLIPSIFSLRCGN